MVGNHRPSKCTPPHSRCVLEYFSSHPSRTNRFPFFRQTPILQSTSRRDLEIHNITTKDDVPFSTLVHQRDGGPRRHPLPWILQQRQCQRQRQRQRQCYRRHHHHHHHYQIRTQHHPPPNRPRTRHPSPRDLHPAAQAPAPAPRSQTHYRFMHTSPRHVRGRMWHHTPQPLRHAIQRVLVQTRLCCDGGSCRSSTTVFRAGELARSIACMARARVRLGAMRGRIGLLRWRGGR